MKGRRWTEEEAVFIGNHLRQVEHALMSVAREACGRDGNYLGFHVGCVAVVWNGQVAQLQPHPMYRTEACVPAWCHSDFFRTATGHNWKPLPQGGANVHAEHEAITKLQPLLHAGWQLVALYVAGDLQPDDESGVATETLHPCGTCRRTLASMSSVVDEDLLIVTTGRTHGSPIELHTLSQLIALHSPRPA